MDYEKPVIVQLVEDYQEQLLDYNIDPDFMLDLLGDLDTVMNEEEYLDTINAYSIYAIECEAPPSLITKFCNEYNYHTGELYPYVAIKGEEKENKTNPNIDLTPDVPMPEPPYHEYKPEMFNENNTHTGKTEQELRKEFVKHQRATEDLFNELMGYIEFY